MLAARFERNAERLDGQGCVIPAFGTAMDSKLTTSDSAILSAVRARTAGSGHSAPELADSIRALKDLAAKNQLISPTASNSAAGLAGDPLATAYEKKISSLQDSLKERDQVVQMLTQRLEQAADQLDRVQRYGNGRSGTVAAALSPELVENQQSLVEQLSRVLGEWEETHAGQTLARIESQITEIRDLVSTGPAYLSGVNVGTAALPMSASDSAIRKESSSSKASGGASVFSDIPNTESKSGWEAIKAAMLTGESSSNLLGHLRPPSNTAAPTSVQQSTPDLPAEVAVARPQTTPEALPEPPALVDFDTADQLTLIDAIRSRDEYIMRLLRRLSTPDATTLLPDWEKLNFVPEDMHRELIGLRDRLQEKLRVAEVDLSLQRAKLAREEAKLAVKAESLARQMRQLGLAADELAPPGHSREAPVTPQGRRWLQFLQRSTGTADPDAK